MKKIILSLTLLSVLFSTSLFAQPNNDPYSFVTNFELVSVRMEGSKAFITVRHGGFEETQRFELIPGAACAESYPAQCYGVVVRLDSYPSSAKTIETTFTVELSEMFYKEGVIVTIYGPNGVQKVVRY